MSTALPDLRPTRERSLWERVAAGDPVAREELTVRYLPLARRLASRYSGFAEPFDDLLQVASLGLLKAIDRYDPERGIPFSGFASPTVLGELKRHFRDKVWTVRVPRALHDLLAKMDRAVAALTVELQRSPTVEEIAGRIEAEPEAVLEALAASDNRRILSIDRPVSGADEEESDTADWLGDEDEAYLRVEDRLTIDAVVPELGNRDREVLRMRFVEELTQSQIAARLGCSQMHVSRILRRLLETLREKAEKQRRADEERLKADERRPVA